MDMQCELSGVFAVMEFMLKHFPGRQYFICLQGNDLIETPFSIVCTARGTGGVLDILQLRDCLDVVAQLEELFALEPKWRHCRKRAKYGDNMAPATTGLAMSRMLTFARRGLMAWPLPRKDLA